TSKKKRAARLCRPAGCGDLTRSARGRSPHPARRGQGFSSDDVAPGPRSARPHRRRGARPARGRQGAPDNASRARAVGLAAARRGRFRRAPRRKGVGRRASCARDDRFWQHSGCGRGNEGGRARFSGAAGPKNLLETELFGYEKGAFTGAGARKLGKFELAHRGTLFLDEIGDLPLPLQAKILRALEEKRFERVGGTTPLQVDARVVAATNRNRRA